MCELLNDGHGQRMAGEHGIEEAWKKDELEVGRKVPEAQSEANEPE